jgi:PAS domain S-box-containing protein
MLEFLKKLFLNQRESSPAANQLQRAESGLRESQEHFEQLVADVRDYAIFLLDRDGYVRSWNAGAERIKGYKAAEIMGQHFSRFYPREAVERDWPGEELRRASVEGRFEDENWRVRKDGSQFWANVVITALRDEAGEIRGFLKVTRDLTERRQAEENARRLLQEETARQAAEASAREAQRARDEESRQREQLRVTLTSIGDAVIVTDNEGRVTLLNPVAERLVGWTTEQARGSALVDVFRIVNEQTRQPVENPVAKVLRDGRTVGLANHTVLIARDGTQRPIDDCASPIKDTNGATSGVVLIFRDVSQQRQTAEALRESEERFRLLADNITQLAWMARADGHIFWYNHRWYEYTGTTPEQMEGWGWQSVHDPKELPRVLERWKASLASGEPLDMVFPLRGADGSFHPFLTRVNPLRDEQGRVVYWFGTNTDISAQKRAEDTSRFLADASATLAALVDYESTLSKVARLAVPFFADWCTVDVIGPDGSLRRLSVVHADPARVQLAQEAAHRYPPRPEDRFGPPNILRTGQPEMVADINDELLVAAARDEEHLRLLRELGLRSYIGVPMIAHGQSLGVLSFITSESGRRYGPADLTLAEDLAHRAAVAIDNARLYAELRQTDRLKDEFLAMLAHELRNPLAPIRNALYIMKQSGAGGGAFEQAQDMADRQVRHMARLLDDLLDVARINRGRIELRKETVDVAVITQRTVEAMRPLIDERRHELTVSLADEPLHVEADPTRLEQVLTNLLNNAAKYTDPGGRITVSAGREDGEVVLRVRDTGIGIAPDILPRIFDLFVQAERRLDRSQGGIGIGLTLVRKLIELHGGRIEATSAGIGQGSEFIIRLPATTNQPIPNPGEPAPAPSPQLPRRRVLVVDDSPDAADSLALLLKLAGQDVRAVYEGPAALTQAETYRPDLVFLDIGMPGLDGYEVARRLRRLPNAGDMFLVALTGWGQDEDRRRSQEAGFDRHLIKPVEMKDLHELLANLKQPSR